jgi:hypothetical protein
MDVAAIAGAMLSAQAGRAQQSIAASIMKTNANHDAEIVKMVVDSQQSLAQYASAGLGQNLDMSV